MRERARAAPRRRGLRRGVGASGSSDAACPWTLAQSAAQRSAAVAALVFEPVECAPTVRAAS